MDESRNFLGAKRSHRNSKMQARLNVQMLLIHNVKHSAMLIFLARHLI